jgi:cytochrome c553
MLAAASGAGGQPATEVHPALPSCHSCHGRAGISDRGTVPNLAGQKAPYLVAQLQAFRRGDRKHAVMAAIAAQLSEQDMQVLADHWARLPADPGPGAGAGVTPVRSRTDWPAAFPQGFERYRYAVDGESVVQGWANRLALEAAAQGRPLPDGSIIVVSHHRLQTQADGHLAAGPALAYDTMQLRAGSGAKVPQLLRNGDWDYAQFDAQTQRRDGLNQAACLACHQPLAARSHVFTSDALTRHAREAALR